MSTHTRPELTFDGFGINGPDEYRTRLYTFTRPPNAPEPERVTHYGNLFAAAPDLLAACEAIVALEDGHGRLNLPMCAGQARAALARATGKDVRS